MAKNLPAKAAAELDKYRKSASRANAKARKAPMDAAVKGAPISIAAAGVYGIARKNVALLDSNTGEMLSALLLAAVGYLTGNPMGIQAATGVAAVAAHNAAEDMNFGS